MRRDHTALLTATCIAVIATAMAWFSTVYRTKRDFTEQDLIAEIKASTPAPVPEVDQALDFESAEEAKKLQAEFLRVARRARPRLAACLERWTTPPDIAQVRMVTDPAGRLEKIAIADAPEAIQSCMLNILAAAQWPRKADGVVRFHARSRDAGWLGQPVVDQEDTGDTGGAEEPEPASSGEPSPG